MYIRLDTGASRKNEDNRSKTSSAMLPIGHRWQRSVWRGMLYAYLRWLIGAYVAQRLGG